MNRKTVFCLGQLVLAGLVILGASSSEAAVKVRARTTAKSARSVAAAKRAIVYSAERSQSRKMKLARGRAIATANPESAGVIGSIVWKRFVLVLEYKAKQIFLDPLH